MPKHSQIFPNFPQIYSRPPPALSTHRDSPGAASGCKATPPPPEATPTLSADWLRGERGGVTCRCRRARARPGRTPNVPKWPPNSAPNLSPCPQIAPNVPKSPQMFPDSAPISPNPLQGPQIPSDVPKSLKMSWNSQTCPQIPSDVPKFCSNVPPNVPKSLADVPRCLSCPQP